MQPQPQKDLTFVTCTKLAGYIITVTKYKYIFGLKTYLNQCSSCLLHSLQVSKVETYTHQYMYIDYICSYSYAYPFLLK